MVVLETVSLLVGRHYGVFHRAAVYRVVSGNNILRYSVRVPDIYICKSAGVWRRRGGVAIDYLRYNAARRSAAALSRYYGAIPQQAVSRGQGQTQVSGQRGILNV